ncbi:alpha/beta fold hydrolase, partial [Kibdelosporangium lantanae]
DDSAAGVNLTTHIDQVVAFLAGLEDVVLVGHSYGGMVITGAADRAPDRVRSLIYLDAFVPQDGDNCWNLTNDDQRAWYVDVDETGFGTPPLPFFDARAKPHPLATFLQRIRLTGSPSRFRKRDYVYATKWGDASSPFTPTYLRLKDDPEWTVHTPDAAHNLMRDIPDELVRICLSHA